MISPEEPDAPWQNATSSKYGRGIRSGVGSLFITDHGSVNLLDADGNLVTQSSPIKNQSDISFLASGGRVYGRGAGADDARHLSYYGNVTPVVMNWFGKGSQTHVPYYYTTDGYGALGVSAGTWTKPSGSFLSSTYDGSPVEIRWHDVEQGSLELYLMPAASLQLGTTAYYNLVGRPRVPPLWTFGFIASRWGWEDHEYIDDTLLRFRSGEYPADAFVIDFEWYTKEPDYTYTKDGNASCDDFGFNDLLFPNPRQQLTDYREKLHFRFGGIRKSRFCNSETLSMARKKGWILPQGALGGEKYYAEGREFNWTNPDVRSWYREHMTPLIADGISFWWNDEMESQYFNYFWINIAQAQSFHEVHPTKRFWSINRNFAPGMARLGVGFWTGDSSPTWPELGLQPGYVLNWALAGAPYVASDIGGFTGNTTADLLVRWYQVGVFMPIMRVHCTGGQWATPRWPWLWGTDAEKALTKAMQLRYRLISYHYSLAMAMYLDGSLWMKPMVMSPSVEISQNLSDTTSQWFDGELLVAPVLRKDSVKEIYLPQGIWYPFEGFEQGAWNNGPAIEGPHFVGGHARYDEIPVYAPSGCIVPLAPVVQYTEALPGGPLEVRIYPGKDATFPLYEDDGETLYYEYGHVKTTRFSWNDKLRKLSWSVSGEASGSTQFKRMFATVIEPQGGSSTSEVVDLGSGGSISLHNSENAVLLSAELQTTTELPS